MEKSVSSQFQKLIPRYSFLLSLLRDVEGVRGLVYSYDPRTGLPSIEFY